MGETMMSYQEILETLHRYRVDNVHGYSIARLGVFGSLARHQGTDASDIDIVVELDEPDLFTLIGIKQDLEELLNQKVDIVRYRQHMNLELKRRIDAEAVYV